MALQRNVSDRKGAIDALPGQGEAAQLGPVSGFIPGMGELIGSVCGPIIAGRAADLVGLQAPFLIMAGCSLAGAVLGLGLKECLGVKPHDPLEAALAVAETPA